MGILFVVATPIGNLEDITIRALNTLRDADLIACEDTRRTRILLDRYSISISEVSEDLTSEMKNPSGTRENHANNIKESKLISYHQHSKLQKIDRIVEELKSGKNVALVTDAGTPGINDPGGVLVERVLSENIKVIPIPGPCALTTLLSVSGIPADRFLFLGFLPKKKGRQTMMRNLMKISNMDLYDAIVIYESPYRVLRSLEDLQLAVGNHQIIIGRELTKKFEEIFRGSVGKAIEYFKENKENNEGSSTSLGTLRGEFVICIKSK